MGTQGDIKQLTKEGIDKASKELRAILSYFIDKKKYSLKQYYMVGSYRRNKELMDDLDIIIETENVPNDFEKGYIFEDIWQFPEIISVKSKGSQKMTIIAKSGLQIDLILANSENIGSMLLYFTGSPSFNIALRSRAKKLGFKLNEYGLYNSDGKLVCPSNSEETIFKALGLKYIEPEERSINFDDWSGANRLFKKHKLEETKCQNL
jgi:DNA polymerase (family 10)